MGGAREAKINWLRSAEMNLLAVPGMPRINPWVPRLGSGLRPSRLSRAARPAGHVPRRASAPSLRHGGCFSETLLWLPTRLLGSAPVIVAPASGQELPARSVASCSIAGDRRSVSGHESLQQEAWGQAGERGHLAVPLAPGTGTAARKAVLGCSPQRPSGGFQEPGCLSAEWVPCSIHPRQRSSLCH